VSVLNDLHLNWDLYLKWSSEKYRLEARKSPSSNLRGDCL